MQGFPGIFCYILGVKVTDIVSLRINQLKCSVFVQVMNNVDLRIESQYCLVMVTLASSFIFIRDTANYL